MTKRKNTVSSKSDKISKKIIQWENDKKKKTRWALNPTNLAKKLFNEKMTRKNTVSSNSNKLSKITIQWKKDKKKKIRWALNPTKLAKKLLNEKMKRRKKPGEL